MPSTKIISKEAFSAISLAEMKNYLKYEDTEDEALILHLMSAACERVEKYCSILLRECTIDAIYDEYDIDEGEVMLPIAPCSRVTNVYLINSEAIETSVTTYYQKGLNHKTIECPTWTGEQIKVRYIAGYGITTTGYTTEEVPEIAKQCIYKTVAQWFENRDNEGTLSGEVRKLLNQISYTAWI